MKLKKLLASFMAACMIVTAVPVTAMATSYTDVAATDWYYQPVTWVAEEGLMDGATETTFAPETNATRGEIVYALHQMAGMPKAEKVAPFLDVTSNLDCADAVAWAAENKVVSGYDAQIFGPADPVTREQMSAILYRFAKYLGSDVTAETSLQVFSDYAKVDAYAVDAMEWSCAEGLFSGMGDGTLNPDGFITRAQVASILYRYDVKLDGDTSKDVVADDNEDKDNKEFTVTFDLNYGDKDAEEVTVEEGDTVDEPNEPSRSRYRFRGWYTKASGGEKFDFDTEITEDITLYAQWQKKSSGGSSSSRPSHTHDYVYNEAEAGWHICDCGDTELCKPNVVEGEPLTCIVCGAIYIVAAEATFEYENVAIVNEDGVGLESYGNVTVTGGTIEAGTPADYAVIIRDGEATFKDVDVTSAGGGVGVVGGANAIFNGDVAVNTASTSGRYNFYVAGEGTELTIKDGSFSFSETLNQKRAYIYAGAGATVNVEGGNFGPASTRSGYTAGIMGEGTVIITGGTFGFDPSAWVAEGYEAVKAGSTWTVSEKESSLSSSFSSEPSIGEPDFSTPPVSLKAPLRGSASNALTSTAIDNDPEIEDVAKIGSTGYDTLQDAINAA